MRVRARPTYLVGVVVEVANDCWLGRLIVKKFLHAINIIDHGKGRPRGLTTTILITVTTTVTTTTVTLHATIPAHAAIRITAAVRVAAAVHVWGGRGLGGGWGVVGGGWWVVKRGSDGGDERERVVVAVRWW